MNTNTETGEGLLRAIIDDPASDDLRLIMADWLEENGEPERGEFIRCQVTLDTCPLCARIKGRGCINHDALRRRERNLLRAHQLAWLPRPLMDLQSEHAENIYAYRRGLPAEVSLTLTDWCGTECLCARDAQFRASGLCKKCHSTCRIGGHGPALVQAAPLERVTLTDREPAAYRPFSPYFRWFDGSRSDGPDSTDRDELPGEMWKIYVQLVDQAGKTWEHATRAEADEFASAACLAWARSQPVPV